MWWEMCWWNYVMIIVRRACGGSLCRLRFGFRTVSKPCFGALCEICIAPKWFIGIYVERGHARDVTEHGSCSWYSSHCQSLSSFAALCYRWLYGPRHISINNYMPKTRLVGFCSWHASILLGYRLASPPQSSTATLRHIVREREPTGRWQRFEFIPNLNAFMVPLKFHAVAHLSFT